MWASSLDFSTNEEIPAKIVYLINFFIFFVYTNSLFVSSRPIDGSPKYTWLATLPVFIFVYPAIMIAAYNTHPYPTTYEWLFAGWQDAVPGEGRPYEQLWICCFIAHMVKDFVTTSPSTMLVAHHIFAINIALAFLYNDTQPAIFCLGSTIMELGSATYNAAAVYPTNPFLLSINKWGMTTSNTAALLLTCVYVYDNRDQPFNLSLAIGACGFCMFRQYVLKISS